MLTGGGTGGGQAPTRQQRGATVPNAPPPTFGAQCETLCYVLLGCFSAWAATECWKAKKVGGSGVEMACPVKRGSKWSLGRCVYTLCLR